MKKLFDNVSLECSRNVTKTYSTSFSLAVKMLANHIQDPIYAIYGFVRLADEIVDSFHNFNKAELLTEFENDLSTSLERKISLNPILNAFQQVVHDYGIEREMIDAFLASMRSDLDKTDYDTVEDYNSYIYGSADVVGLMCLKVFVQGDNDSYDALKPYAMSLGSAFQKVNFLRDIKDDSELLKRSYFPNIDTNNLNFETKQDIIKDIESDFTNAFIGVKKLPKDVRFGVYTAYFYYRNLFLKLKKTNAEDILKARIRVSDPLKVGLLAKSYINIKLNLL
jgi:phytoene/squalene synthetase